MLRVRWNWVKNAIEVICSPRLKIDFIFLSRIHLLRRFKSPILFYFENFHPSASAYFPSFHSTSFFLHLKVILKGRKVQKHITNNSPRKNFVGRYFEDFKFSFHYERRNIYKNEIKYQSKDYTVEFYILLW